MPILLENHQIQQNAVPQKTVPSEVNVPSKANDDKQKSKNNIPYQMIITTVRGNWQSKYGLWTSNADKTQTLDCNSGWTHKKGIKRDGLSSRCLHKRECNL